jgi:ABC-type molybdenum transport system ATPase subunit/photorepair protein PhrA
VSLGEAAYTTHGGSTIVAAITPPPDPPGRRRDRILPLRAVRVTSFSSVSKQYGKQVLFVDASFQLIPGDKAGLVGPNGSGKTTLFRMIVGEEFPDERDVSVPKKLRIGVSEERLGMPSRWLNRPRCSMERANGCREIMAVACCPRPTIRSRR